MASVRKPTRRKSATRRRPAGKTPAREKKLRLAGVGSDSVQRATGKAWEEWLKLLDRAGAKKMLHKEIALLLSREFGVPNWWSQMVTVGYEQARGLRDLYQHADGYAANASRTFEVAIDRLYGAWSDPKARARWLPKAPIVVKRSTDGKSMRMTWTTGGSRVDVNFFSKGAGRSLVQVEHAKLASSSAVTRQKAYWGKALERLKALLEAPH